MSSGPKKAKTGVFSAIPPKKTSRIVIEGGADLSGSVTVNGSKNAALPLLAATLLSDGEITLHNIPRILDVERFLEILNSVGARASHNKNTVTVSSDSLDFSRMNRDLIGLLRGSILMLGAALGRGATLELPLPGGDVIGSRPLDAHFDGFRQLGAKIETNGDSVVVDGTTMHAAHVVLPEFSVTGTENIMLAAARLPGTTRIDVAAAEPHVVALASLLNEMGAVVTGAGTHHIEISGNPNLGSAEFTNIPDMLEAGFLILLGVVTRSAITIKSVPADTLQLFFKKLDDIRAVYSIGKKDSAGNASVTTGVSSELASFKMQSLPYPGIPTDLQAPFAVVATQAQGASLIHDPLYEDRFKHLVELKKMGAKVTACDPHRAIVEGPTKLVGREIPSLDIRAGATLVMAGLIAKGTTVIHNAETIDRGYEDLVGRLQALGATISRES